MIVIMIREERLFSVTDQKARTAVCQPRLELVTAAMKHFIPISVFLYAERKTHYDSLKRRAVRGENDHTAVGGNYVIKWHSISASGGQIPPSFRIHQPRLLNTLILPGPMLQLD